MSSTIKNAIIFLSIGIVLILVYVFFIRKPAEQDNLVSSANIPVVTTPTTPAADLSSADKDFLPLLLSVKSIKLNDLIFKDEAFNALTDGSIEIIPDGTEGRPNPFAPFGFDEEVTDETVDANTEEEEPLPFTPPSVTTPPAKTTTPTTTPTTKTTTTKTTTTTKPVVTPPPSSSSPTEGVKTLPPRPPVKTN